jgi:heterotetrameric sarcosine oxidase gamma subunit
MLELVTDGRMILRVQTWDTEAAVPKEAEELLGTLWPRDVGASVEGRGLGTVMCVGPTEWLASGEARQGAPAARELDRVFEGTAFRVTDVSRALFLLRITGGAALRVIGKGCSLDLDLTAFAVGRVVRTRMAGIPVVVRRTDVTAFECLVTRSYGDYFDAWWEDAALEFRGGGLKGGFSGRAAAAS